MSRKLRIVIIIVALAVFCGSAYQLGWHYYQELTVNRGLEDIAQEIIVQPPAPEADVDVEEPFSTLSIDFDALYKINTDIIAWLYIPDTPVSYPILHGNDNQFYLDRTFDRRSNVLGSIFLDYRNSEDYEDLNSIIYGHDTRNDLMFGSLKKYKEQAYANENKYIHIIRDNEVRVYEIFSIYETLATSNTYTIRFASDESYAEYLEEMSSKTIVNAAAPPDTESIITLSTCTSTARNMRLVIQAKLVEVYGIVGR
jgi:sortase B